MTIKEQMAAIVDGSETVESVKNELVESGDDFFFRTFDTRLGGLEDAELTAYRAVSKALGPKPQPIIYDCQPTTTRDSWEDEY